MGQLIARDVFDALSRVSGPRIDGCYHQHGMEVGTGRHMAKKEA